MFSLIRFCLLIQWSFNFDIYFNQLYALININCDHILVLLNWMWMTALCEIFFFFLIYVGCPGQLTRTTTIPHGSLDILQAQEQVRHRGGDRRAHRGSNPGRGRNKSHGWPQQLDPQVQYLFFLSPSRTCFLYTELKIVCIHVSDLVKNKLYISELND